MEIGGGGGGVVAWMHGAAPEMERRDRGNGNRYRSRARQIGPNNVAQILHPDHIRTGGKERRCHTYAGWCVMQPCISDLVSVVCFINDAYLLH